MSELKILAIDDTPDNLTTLRAVLHDNLPQAKLVSALNGRDGLDLARREDPDVILLDISMPGMDGYEVCETLKTTEELQTIPVVFLTAVRGERQSRIRALEAGGDGFLTKPFDEVELTAQIRAMAKVKAANRLQHRERVQLAKLVAERTRELEEQLAERKQVEEKLRRQTAVTSAINRLLQSALQADSDKEVARICLNEAAGLTDSLFGWIGELNSAGRLDTIVMSNRGAELTMGMGEGPVRNLVIRGVLSLIVKGGESLIVNAPSSHPAWIKPPPGHPEITSFLGVPLRQQGRIVGLIALGNKPSGYAAHDQDAIITLSVALVEALQRKRAEALMASQHEELRRWHAAILGREQRVLELKQEVNQLLLNEGKPARYPSAVELET
jgi:DNA-binding response OmpR family regulator